MIRATDCYGVAPLGGNGMGCDIHSFVEVRTAEGWMAAKPVFESDHRWDIQKYGEEATQHFSRDDYVNTVSPIDARNYALFGFLASVRWGGPTCLSLIGTEPATILRGLPDDVGSYVNSEFQDWGSDGHSAHWLSLRELVVGNMAAALHHPEYTYFSDQLNFSMEQLLAYADERKLSHEDIRVVFWFDN